MLSADTALFHWINGFAGHSRPFDAITPWIARWIEAVFGLLRRLYVAAPAVPSPLERV